MKHFLLMFMLCLGLWVLLTGSLSAQELVAGVLVALLVSSLTASQSSLLNSLKLSPAAFIAFIRYLLSFTNALLLANLDMAKRVLHPALPLSPAMVEISTQIQSDLGKLILANSITLTPGTLSVDVTGNRLLIHWIACPENISAEQATRQIAGNFEKHILGFVE